jgi:hypothetical protein
VLVYVEFVALIVVNGTVVNDVKLGASIVPVVTQEYDNAILPAFTWSVDCTRIEKITLLTVLVTGEELRNPAPVVFAVTTSSGVICIESTVLIVMLVSASQESFHPATPL